MNIGIPLPARAGLGSAAWSNGVYARSTISCWRDRRSYQAKACSRSAAAPVPPPCRLPRRWVSAVGWSASTSPSLCLAGARQRIAASGLGNISLVQADAQVHRFEGTRFDLIASRFGVMFFVDPAVAFSNLLPAATCGATGRSPMFYLLGTAQGEWPLADPPRDRLAPFGTSSAEPASSAGTVGLQ